MALKYAVLRPREDPAPRVDDLKLEVTRGADEGWDTPIKVWSSEKPFESRNAPRGYHTLTVRLSGSRGLSFLDAGGVWRPKPLGAALVVRPAEMTSGLSGANPVRFADICLPVDLTRQLCASLFTECDAIRPFGGRVVFCSDDRLCADATALVERWPELAEGIRHTFDRPLRCVVDSKRRFADQASKASHRDQMA